MGIVLKEQWQAVQVLECIHQRSINVDRCTHRYLIETISNSLHPKIMLASRYVTFHKSLITSSKLSVRVLARLVETDQRTVMGRTLDSLCKYLWHQSPDIHWCEDQIEVLWNSFWRRVALKHGNRTDQTEEPVSLSPWLHSRVNQCNDGLHMHHLGLLLSSPYADGRFFPWALQFSPAPTRTKYSN